jgi:hypothetical protein
MQEPLAWQFDCRDKLKNPAAIPKELQITPICMALDPISLKPAVDHIGGSRTWLELRFVTSAGMTPSLPLSPGRDVAFEAALDAPPGTPG